MAARMPKEVKFQIREDGSRGTARARRSDSGVEQMYDVQALQEALQAAANEVDRYKTKAKQLDLDLTLKNKELHESKAQFRAVVVQNQNLEEVIKKNTDENNGLMNDNAILDRHNRSLEKEVARLNTRLAAYEAQPEMTTAVPSTKPSRSDSKRAKDDTEKEKSRLRGRFDRDSDSGGSSGKRSSSKAPTRTRRSSISSSIERPYVENWGPAGTRPAVAMPPSPTAGRRLDGHVSTSKTSRPVISPSYNTAYASVPRSRGTVEYEHYTYEPEPGHYVGEDGDYHPHPLPEKTSSSRKHR